VSADFSEIGCGFRSSLPEQRASKFNEESQVDASTKSPRPRRFVSWFAICATLACLVAVLGLLCLTLPRVRLLRQIEALGGGFDTKIVTPKWLQPYVAEHLDYLFGPITEVSIECGATDELVQVLAAERYLNSLAVSGEDLSDQGLEHLTAFPELRFLSVDSPLMTDKALAVISHCRALEHLHLKGGRFSDGGLSQLGSLKSLGFLSFRESRGEYTGEAMSGIASLSRLQFLWLHDVAIGDDGAVHLSRIKTLLHLELKRTGITNRCGRHFALMKRLTFLDVEGNAVDDSFVADVHSLPQLYELNLSRTAVTDASVPHLSEMSFLRHLDISGTRISAEAQRRLVQSLPNVAIRCSFESFDCHEAAEE
jgi:hypothetical protein